jgi:hypothetical protein
MVITVLSLSGGHLTRTHGVNASRETELHGACEDVSRENRRDPVSKRDGDRPGGGVIDGPAE